MQRSLLFTPSLLLSPLFVSTLLVFWFACLGLLTNGYAWETHPLPFASSWNTGQISTGFTPDWQIEQIEQGHRLLLTMSLSGPDGKFTESTEQYLGNALRKAAEKELPISFVSADWDYPLYASQRYYNLPAAESPCWVDLEGMVHKAVSPFGPVKWWQELGRRWTDCELIRKLETIYPDPPLVVFLTNNDANRFSWKDCERDIRYLKKYGKGRSDQFKRKVVGQGFIERYSALIAGIQEGFDKWKGRVIVGAHGRSPLKWVGRSSDWLDGGNFVRESLYVPGRLAIDPHFLDAVSVRNYINTWTPNNDYSVYSPQTAAMNRVAQKLLYQSINPDLWWEISVWDAAMHGNENAVEKPKKWRLEGQSVPPERFGGLVRWLMWIPRSRAVRFFRFYHEPRQPEGRFPGSLASYEQVIQAVDDVHENAILRRFWETGRLVANTSHEHPYQANVLTEFQKFARWFQLDSSVNPPWPWNINTPVHVWAFAYVIGEEPNREWLVYTFAPLSARVDVDVQLPGFGEIRVDAPQAGAFYHVVEKTRNVRSILVGGPASVAINVEKQHVEVGTPVPFRVEHSFNPGGKLTSFEWDFGDGSKTNGTNVRHQFKSAGQHVVQLVATSNDGAKASRLLPMFVGMKPQKDLVLWLTMDKKPTGVMYDVSGRRNLGQPHGTNLVADDQRGQVVELDGRAAYIKVFNTEDINQNARFGNRTLLISFKATHLDGRQTIYEEGSSQCGMNVYLEGSRLFAGVWNRDGEQASWLSHSSIEEDRWYEIAVVLKANLENKNSGQVQLIVNGTTAGTGKGFRLVYDPFHPGDINIGRAGSTRFHDNTVLKAPRPWSRVKPEHYFAGRLDEIRIYNRAIAQVELQRLDWPHKRK